MFEILARSDGTEKPTPLQYRPFRAGAAAPSRRPFGQMLRPAGSGRQILLEFHRGVEADDAGVEREDIGAEAGVVAVQIGRASCRKRVCQYGSCSGVAESLKKK